MKENVSISMVKNGNAYDVCVEGMDGNLHEHASVADAKKAYAYLGTVIDKMNLSFIDLRISAYSEAYQKALDLITEVRSSSADCLKDLINENVTEAVAETAETAEVQEEPVEETPSIPSSSVPTPEFEPVIEPEVVDEEETPSITASVPESPMIKQYKDLKAKHPDALLLFRCGDFYESYFQDARDCANILGIMLTHRTGSDPDACMAGFPYHALDSYLPRLIRAGKRVAICDQIDETKAPAKKPITELATDSAPKKRGRKPKTISDTKSLFPEQNQYPEAI